VAARHLDWEGCFNVRDLGGLPVAGGGRIRPGALVRADALEGLSARGWAALAQHGVRTVVDLRNPDERGFDNATRPPELATVHVPLDGIEDRPFWDAWDTSPAFGTPLYYAPHLERFPERHAAVVRAVARAAPGGVAVHCVGGRDRTGQVTMLLLALCGVEPAAIAADYALSAERLPARHAALGEPDQEPELAAFLAERGTTGAALVAGLVQTGGFEAALRAGGVTDDDLAALRARLVEPARGPRSA
jgi:hypothetical protein